MKHRRYFFSPKAGALALSVALLALSGCDFTVTNPGPVQDEFLNDNSANAAIVNGSGRMVSEALNWVAYTGAALSREITPSGSIGSFGISVQQRNGFLDPNETNTHWNFSQRARSVAEQGIERLRENLGGDFGSSELAAEIVLWAAYANRLIGENFCCTVIDGGAAEAGSVSLQRAEGQFSEALDLANAAGATDFAIAAQAGRASVRMGLGDWNGAVADAEAVLARTGGVWSYDMPYFNIDTEQYNRIYYAGSGDGPYRAHTVWHSPYQDNFEEEGDLRTAYSTDPDIPTGDAAVDGEPVPWYFQLKHDNRESSIRLSSSHEMRLILAEHALVNNSDINAALEQINVVRQAATMEDATAATLDEAWTVLKRERGIELWLEGRRLGDVRRWEEAGRPGDYHFWEIHDWKGPDDGSGANLRTFDGVALSFPIAQDEIDTNPNVSAGRPF
ncbi:MAG: RagB/SusD family nutrient uptake outer membrane protein [Rhodothermales bacterium]